MYNELKKYFWVFLFGVTTGALTGISIHYPVKMDVFTNAIELCKDEKGPDEIKVGITGKVYYVRCNSKKTFNFK
jgi:hypothetical protein